MTRFHYPMSIPEDYSPEQVVAILHLLETLHTAIRDVYALQLHELAQLSENDDDLASDEDIPF
jgi:hypothetical protein